MEKVTVELAASSLGRARAGVPPLFTSVSDVTGLAGQLAPRVPLQLPHALPESIQALQEQEPERRISSELN